MEDLYSIHLVISRSRACSEASGVAGGAARSSPAPPAPAPTDLTELKKAQITGHPRYPSLLSAYIECRKVGVPSEVAALLEEIGQERCSGRAASAATGEIGLDPKLDEFMVSKSK